MEKKQTTLKQHVTKALIAVFVLGLWIGARVRPCTVSMGDPIGDARTALIFVLMSSLICCFIALLVFLCACLVKATLSIVRGE